MTYTHLKHDFSLEEDCDRNTYAPFLFMKSQSGYSVLISDGIYKTLYDYGYDDNMIEGYFSGYGMTAIWIGACQQADIDLGNIGWDPEAGMAVAYIKGKTALDIEAIEKVASLGAYIFTDKARLEEARKFADQSGLIAEWD